MNKLKEIIKKLNINDNDLSQYGDFFKLDPERYLSMKKRGKLILTTSINPTSSGEGKTTVSIGIADALNKLNKLTLLALREPSIGPVFGLKGTATGGGEAIVIPEDEINLHFTGDMYAIEMANNLISSVIDNHLYWKTDLNIDPNKIVWKRTSNLNDRSLRETEIQISKSIKRKEEFVITAACDVMTILTLSKDIKDFERRINNAIIGYSVRGKELTIKDLNITGSILALLKNTFKPNIAKTKYDTPTFIHCGPFANIAVGTNSIISTKCALALSDYVVSECGFGSDLGFEKYIDIVCKCNVEQIPDCVVIVVTIKALELHDDYKNSFKVLDQHIKNVSKNGLNYIIAINKFSNDNKDNTNLLTKWLEENGHEYSFISSFVDGPNGSLEIAEKIIKLSEKKYELNIVVDPKDDIKNRIISICKNYYGVDKVSFTDDFLLKLKETEKNGKYKKYSLCMVKSPSTLSGNEKNEINVSDIRINSGGEFLLIYLNNVFLMPGLNKKPNAEKIKYKNNKIENLD